MTERRSTWPGGGWLHLSRQDARVGLYWLRRNIRSEIRSQVVYARSASSVWSRCRKYTLSDRPRACATRGEHSHRRPASVTFHFYR